MGIASLNRKSLNTTDTIVLVGSLIVMILIGNKNPGRSNTAPQRILPAAALRLNLKMNIAKNFRISFWNVETDKKYVIVNLNSILYNFDVTRWR